MLDTQTLQTVKLEKPWEKFEQYTTCPVPSKSSR